MSKHLVELKCEIYHQEGEEGWGLAYLYLT